MFFSPNVQKQGGETLLVYTSRKSALFLHLASAGVPLPSVHPDARCQIIGKIVGHGPNKAKTNIKLREQSRGATSTGTTYPRPWWTSNNAFGCAHKRRFKRLRLLGKGYGGLRVFITVDPEVASLPSGLRLYIWRWRWLEQQLGTTYVPRIRPTRIGGVVDIKCRPQALFAARHLPHKRSQSFS